MIRTPASATTDPASVAPAVGVDIDAQYRKRIPLVWIPATICAGLLIACIYLGARIVTAPPEVKPEALAVKAFQEPTPVYPPRTQPAAPALAFAQPEIRLDVTAQVKSFIDAPLEGPKDTIPIIQPQPGQRYLQIGALSPEATRRYIQRLRDVSLNPHVAPGPKPDLLRVLIGPFEDRDALTESETQIQERGIDHFVRKY